MNLTLRVLLVSNFLNTLAYALFFPLYAIFVQRIDSSILTISGSLGWYTFLTGVVILIAGKLEDHRFKNEHIIILGYSLLVIGSVSFLLVNSVITLYLAQTINAVGIGIVAPAWKTLYSRREDKGMEAKEWSFFDGGNMLLAGFATIIGGLVVQLYGFDTLIGLMVGLQLASALAAVKLLACRQHGKRH